MALYTKWTRAQLRSAARERLTDTSSRWWSDTLINDWLDDWQRELNQEFEFVWAKSTSTTSVGTFTLGTISPEPHVWGRLYCDGRFLPYLSRDNMLRVSRDWRVQDGDPPICVYNDARDVYIVWPQSTSTHTYILEYPAVSTFATDTSTMSVPAWTKYSAIAYCMFRAYSNQGPNYDPQKAARYKSLWLRTLNKLRRFYDNYFPQSGPQLKLGGRFEKRLRTPFRTVLELPWRI